MNYGSVCSGIEAATVAWHPLGWKPAFFSEIEEFPRTVLSHHYPDVPLHGDFTTIKEKQYGAIDLLVGGTPCQSFSIAGLRGGLDDDRGNLSLEYLRLAERKGARWLVWENVPGVLSANKGRDFGSILGGLQELGYGFAYRVLDAQFFGVPQRRRRVFLIGYLGDWRPPAAVLFERESLRRNSPPSREEGKRIASAFETGPSGSRYTDLAPTLDTRCKDGPIRNQLGIGVMHGKWPADVAPTLNAAFGNKMGLEDQHALGGAGLFVPDIARTLSARYDGSPCADRAPDVIAFSCKDYGNDVQTNVTPTMRSMNSANGRQNGGGQLAVLTCGDRGLSVDQACGNMAVPVSVSESQSGYIRETVTTQALGCAGGKPGQGYQAIRNANAVRRLTPRECERLQGFPDDYTLIPYRGKPAADCPDGPRYKALGNSMAVPVMHWIGQRIQKVDDILKSQSRQAHT